MRKRLLIFAFHDRHKKIDTHVINYLRKIKSYFSEILFISDQLISKKETEKVNLFSKVIQIKHNEKDFGSWKRGLSKIDKNKFDEIYLLNDSVIGPIIDFKKIILKMDNIKSDFWGITSAGKKNLIHLQSYFLCFRKNCFNSIFFINFFKNVKFLKSKGELVQKYEIGLTQGLLESGFKMAQFSDHYEKDIFSSVVSYDLFKKKKLPFIKVKVLVSNPVRLPNVCHILKYIDSNLEFLNYIRRVNENDDLNHLYYKLPIFNYSFISRKLLQLNAKMTHSKKWWRFYVKIFGIYIFFFVLPIKKNKSMLYNTYDN